MSDEFERPGCLFGLLEALSIFDWISPSVAIGKTAAHAVKKRSLVHQWTFWFPMQAAAHAGWSMWHIRKYLKDNGVHIVSESSLFDEGALSVDLDDAAYAEYLLILAEVPMKSLSYGAPKR